MSELSMDPGIERVERLARGLASALAARRIYASDHRRARASSDTFLATLRVHLGNSTASSLRLLVREGLLFHEGMPLGEGAGSISQLAAFLQQRGCGGIAFNAAIREDGMQSLLDWLLGRGPLASARPCAGVELLPPSAAEDEGRTGLSGARSVPEFGLPDKIQASAARALDHVLADARAGRRVDLTEIVELTRWTAEAAYDLGSQLLAPTQTKNYDDYTFQHSVNVFLISTALLQPLARDRTELARFSQAALLHDVGKSLVPQELLMRKGKLTDGEFEVIRRHPVFGAEILQRCPHVDPIAVEVAFCHHMRDGGLGYPKVTLPVKVGPVTGVVQVADMFEALTAARPYHSGHSTAEAVSTILSTPGLESRRPQLMLLLERLTQAPPGSEVRLNTGERALVLKTFPTSPGNPLVRLIEDAKGRPVPDKHDVDLREASPDQSPIVGVFLKPGLVRSAREAALIH